MNRIKIKPLTVNEAWKGRKFKTDKYKKYQEALTLMLPKKQETFERMMIVIRFGFSSKRSDIDNPVKPLLDILQSKYGFNDNQIYGLLISKEESEEEYIEFEIRNFDLIELVYLVEGE